VPTQATIAITPGSGQFLDAVSLTIGPNTVVRETMVIADPTNPTSLAGVTVGGALMVDASGTIQLVSGTITANQGTSPWVVTGNLTHNNAAPAATELGVLPALANAAAPTYTEGKQVLLSTDLTGALRVNVGSVVASNNVTEWNSVALGSPSAYGTGPGAINVIGVNAFVTNSVAVTGTFFQATQPVSIAGDVEVVQDTAADFNATVVGTGTFAVQASITTLGQQLAAASVPVVLTAAQISTLTPLTTVAVTQSIAPWIVAGGGTAGSAATGVVTVQGIASMTPLLVTATFSAPQHIIVDSGTLTTVSTVTAVTAITNALPAGTNVIGHVIADSGSTTAVTGNVTVVGTLTNNNAAPLTNNVGALTAIANAAVPSFTEGDQVLHSVDLSGHMRVVATGAAATGAAVAGNPVLVAGKGTDGNAYPVILDTPGNGGGLRIAPVPGISLIDSLSNSNTSYVLAGGSNLAYACVPAIFNGTTWDRQRSAGIGNAVASTGIAAAAAYGEYLSTAPAPTTGKYSALQTDDAGSLFVKNTRRSQTAAQGTTITNSAAATAVTATPAAATFADLSQLVITVTPIAVTAIALTATLSDGTNTYIYDLDTGVIATGGGSSLVVNFNPPLPATSAATGWTIALSVNTVVAHITTVVVLQKQS